VTLHVAPCPRCQAAVVYGERACRTCQQPFDYGSAAVPIPDFETVRATLVAYGLPPPAPPLLDLGAILAPDTAPVVDDGMAAFVERTEHAAVGNVTEERIPDLIDSTLYRSMVPAEVQVERIVDLESTRAERAPDVALDLETASMLDTGRFDGSRDAAVAVEDIPGFIDSSLYAAFSAGPVDVEVVPDLETQGRVRPKRAPAALDDELVPCRDCGTGYVGSVCPSCGARRSVSP